MTGETFRLRGYQIERLIGRGATSEVWLARVRATGERVALKRIGVVDEQQRARAHAEAELLGALDHPNLVRLLGLVAGRDAVVLVLDLADGGSLAELLVARGRLTPGEVSTALAPVAAALAQLHDAGVVHGDVSAANILFTAGGEPLLADVGVARVSGDDRDATATPSYVDPVVAAGHVPGPASDVFMLAGVALHALTGTPPWPGGAKEAAAVGAGGLAERLDEAAVPAGMRRALARALAREPGRRGTAVDLATGLRQDVTPMAVELAAGRARPVPSAWTGPRHAAVVRPPAREARPGRPAFARPAASRPGGPPPTSLVGPRPRPSLPVARRGRWRRLLPLGLVAALALAGAATVWRFSGSDRPAAGTAKHRAQVEPSAPVDDWDAVLVRLDAIRAAAFADRDPSRLGQVYAAGPLLDADVELLRRLVPSGCGLVGVRTRYRDLHTTRLGSGVEIVVAATMTASTLVCDGVVRGRAPGLGPSTLRLRLARTGTGPRIVAQQPV